MDINSINVTVQSDEYLKNQIRVRVDLKIDSDRISEVWDFSKRKRIRNWIKQNDSKKNLINVKETVVSVDSIKIIFWTYKSIYRYEFPVSLIPDCTGSCENDIDLNIKIKKG